MRITNNAGLPQPVYDWILSVQSEYDNGGADLSVTDLINPPRIRILKKRLYDKIEVEAESLLNVTVGSTIHKAIQEASKTGVAERRLTIEVLGWKLSGGMDHWMDGVLSDWKTANKWKTMFAENGRIEEWEEQLNVYAHILRQHEIPVTKTKIFAWFKDWTKPERDKQHKNGGLFSPNYCQGYPNKEWLYFDLKLWSPEDAKDYVYERVKLHQEAEKRLPECPKESLWNGKRCTTYCNVNFGCEQYLSTLKEKK